MNEIKSVRVRRIDLSTNNFSSSTDYKVTLFSDGKKNFKVGVFQPGRSVLFSEYKKDGRFKKFSNDDFIKSAINTLISSNDKPTLLRGGGSGMGQLYFEQLEMDNILNNFDSVDNNIAYKIIQDPWLETPPPFRNFGFDPYYINNGSSIIIRWLKKDISGRTINSGGFKWSDDFGNELSVSKNNDSKKLIYKTVEVISPDNSRYYVNFQGSPFFSKSNSDILNFSGEISDITILSRVLNMWIQNVFTKIYDRYSLEVCKPNYKFCDLIPYIDPIESGNIERLEEDFQQKIEKKKLNVIIPKNLKPKVKEDISFKIFLGDPPKSELPIVEGFDFGDEEDLSDLLLEDEFREVDFQGGEEIFTDLEEVEEARRDGDNQDLETEQEPNNTPGAGTGVKSTGTYTSELPKESSKSGPNGNYAIKYGFNGVPYYGQWDRRWRDVVYGLWSGPGNEKDFVELNMEDKSKWKQSPSNPNIKTEWRNKIFNVKFDGQNGSKGFSSIFGGGCGVTSFSMVINYWMIKLNKGIYTSPIKMAKLACDTGARSKNPPPNGTQPGSSFFKKIKEVFGLNVSACKYDEAVSLVKSGIPVIMCGTWKGFRGDGSVKEQNGGHFVVITGYDDITKRFRVNDPGSTRSTYYFQNNLPKERNNGSSMGFWKITN